MSDPLGGQGAKFGCWQGVKILSDHYLKDANPGFHLHNANKLYCLVLVLPQDRNQAVSLCKPLVGVNTQT